VSFFDNLRKKDFSKDELESKHPLGNSFETDNSIALESNAENQTNYDASAIEYIEKNIVNDSQKLEEPNSYSSQSQAKKTNVNFVEMPKWIDTSNLKAIELNLSFPNGSSRSFLKGISIYVKDETKCRNKVFLSSVEVQTIINFLQSFLANQLPIKKEGDNNDSAIYVKLTPSPKLIIHLDFLDKGVPFHLEFSRVEARFLVDILNGIRLKYPLYLDYNYNHLKKIDLKNGGY
jgi:hypothetical protein